MTVTSERFAQGLSYAEYKAQMTRNLDRLEENERTIDIAGEDLDFFKQLDKPVHVLAIAEDWCGDVIANLPVLDAIDRVSPNLDVRVFLRDQNLDLIDLYLKEGKYRSIPVFAFFDQDFQPIGHWIERPVEVSARQAAMTAKLFAEDPLFADVAPGTGFGELPEPARLRLSQAFGAFREETRSFADHEVVRELRQIVLGQPVSQPAEQPAPTISVRSGPPTKPAAPTGTPIKVKITYCAACGYEPQALSLTSALMHTFVYELASIELIPWQDGSFDVSLDGDVVHSMYRDGGFPENDAIITAVRERLAPAQASA